jgi:hypothetical protein
MSEAAPALKQDQPDEDYYRALLAERGWAPIAGGSPELDEEQADGDLPTPDAPEASASDTPDGEGTESFPDFDFSNVREELREDAERYAQEVKKHFQGDYTKKAQTLAEKRREADRNAGIVEALLDPKSLPSLLAQAGYSEQQILNMYEYEVDDDDLNDDQGEFRDPRVDELLQERQASERQSQVTRFVESEIEALAKERGSEIPEDEQVALDFIGQGLSGQDVPDIQAAGKFLEGVVNARVKAILDSKKAPRVPAGGKPGSRAVDLSKESRDERVARMAQAADEARGSVAA